MSPKTKDLVNKLIIMSSADDRPLVHDQNQRTSRHFAKKVGCTSLDINDPDWNISEEVEKILDCLRSKPPLELSSAQRIIEPEFEFIDVARDVGEDAVSCVPTSPSYELVIAVTGKYRCYEAANKSHSTLDGNGFQGVSRVESNCHQRSHSGSDRTPLLVSEGIEILRISSGQ